VNLACLVLAAGLGTRLLPLTELTPKPLLWVFDRPQIEHVFGHLARSGFTRCVVNTYHLANQFEGDFQQRQPLAVELSKEPGLLGTGGALVHAAPLLGGGPVLVWNADMFGTPDLGPLVALLQRQDAAGTMLVGPTRPPGQGTLGLDDTGAVVRIRAHRGSAPEVASADYLGIGAFSPRIRATLRAPGCLIEDGVIPALLRGERVLTCHASAPVADVGSLGELLRVNLAALEVQKRERWIDPSVAVADDTSLDRVVVARGATIADGARAARCLVLPGARLSGDLRSSIVHPRGVIALG
jgi:mannose-1-phosphate guanylyltransferase